MSLAWRQGFFMCKVCVDAACGKFGVIKLFSKIVLIIALTALTGCGSMQDSPGLLLFGHALSSGHPSEQAQLDPHFHYLRVYVLGKPIILASDTPNIDDRGVTGVWYSAGREVLRFRDGRLVAAIGTPVEWRQVTIPDLPSWAELAQAQKTISWIRIRDVMPGYHYGIRDHLELVPITPPANTNLKGIDPNSLVWFEERLAPSPGGSAAVENDLPPARYALDLTHTGIIVYGEQCLSLSLCFTWQRWPVQTGKNP